MEALQCYATDSDSSEPEINNQESRKKAKLMEVSDRKLVDAVAFNTPHGIVYSESATANASCLPPPPPDLLSASNSSYILQLAEPHAGRIRSFPHVEGNYALHMYIPVSLSAISRRQLDPLMKAAFSIAPDLKPMDIEDVQASRELTLAKEYHLSLSRTVPVRVHQINSIVTMLQNKFEYQKGFWFDLDQWELFVNDEQTRSFLSLEVVGEGLSEICKQIQFVDEVFQLHNLPVYYKTPRPHVSVAWTLGTAILSVQKAMEELKKIRETTRHMPLCSHLVKKIECKIGSRTYCIWKQKLQPRAPI